MVSKLTDNHVFVEVIRVCQHVNTRIKTPSIKLPVMALLKQYKETINPLLRHFDLLYISQGLPRMNDAERPNLLPTLMSGISDNFVESVVSIANLFHIFLRILFHQKLPQRNSDEDSNLRNHLGLAVRPEDAGFLAQWIGKLMLYHRALPAPGCPGLNSQDYEFLTPHGDKATWDPNEGGIPLVETKFTALKFIASGAFEDLERLQPALIASADSSSRLAELGDDILRRTVPSIYLENERIIQELLALFLGHEGPQGSPPAKPALQAKILALLSKSTVVTNYGRDIVRIVEAGLMPASSGADGSEPVKRGLETSKLRTQVFSFTHWIARNASTVAVKSIAPELIGKLRHYLSEQGWPKPREAQLGKDQAERASRSYSYEIIGLLARSCAKVVLMDSDLELLRWLFKSLGGDAWDNDITIGIESALSSVLGAFRDGLSPEVEGTLIELLFHYTTLEVGDQDSQGIEMLRSTRFVAIKFANRSLPFHDASARLMNLLAISSGQRQRKEVVEEARKGLDPYWYRNMNPSDIFTDSMSAGGEAYPTRCQMPEPNTLINMLFKGDMADLLGENRSAAVIFCRNVTFYTALVAHDRAPIIDMDWQRNLDVLVLNDEKARLSIHQYLHNYDDLDESPLKVLLDSAFATFFNPSAIENNNIGDCLLQLCSLGPQWLLDYHDGRLSEISALVYSNKYSTRTTAAELLGLFGSRYSAVNHEILQITRKLLKKAYDWRHAIGQDMYQVHGSLVALAHLVCRNESLFVSSKTLSKEICDLTVSIILDSHDKDAIDAALTALDMLCLYGRFGTADALSRVDLMAVSNRLEGLARGGNEKAVSVLGYLAMQQFETDESMTYILEILYKMHEHRQPEQQFAIGSALSCACIGWSSRSLISARVPGLPTGRTPPRRDLLGRVLDTVLGYCGQTKPSLRQASAIWLLCLVQYCENSPEVYSRLRVLQRAFKGFIADKDSLNQETASRGLTLVYEKGGRDTKDELVKDLVGSFTSSNSNLVGNVTEETELFEPGALPTGTHGSITTYKDIIRLANEVGDPSLIYRFMSLASSSSIWSSRAAFGRFGLSKILSDSSVDGYLARNAKLYPTLFRYRFDPNSNVRKAMNDIWFAVVKDTKATIDGHFKLIIEDLLKSIIAKEWRTREASCAALADLLQGYSVPDDELYLTRIWTVTFKVCDDIKDSVRLAAMDLAKVLTKILIQSFEKKDSSRQSAIVMLGQVLPFLLSPSGLESSAPDVRAFALATLRDIVRNGDKAMLQPFLGELIADRLLPLLSSLEPEAINYVHLNAQKYGMTEQQIDDARLSGVKMSPMMEAIERCINMLDETSMQELVPRLKGSIKTVIGLPSKVGVSRVLVSLSTRQNRIFRPYSGPFLKTIRRLLVDRNETISASAAAACGYISRVATDQDVLGYVTYARQLYLDAEDEKSRVLSGEIMLGIAKYAADKFQSLSSSLLPFVFVAKHDTSDAARELFKTAWEEGMGSRRAVRLLLREITQLSAELLNCHRWPVKHAASFAVGDVIRSLGNVISNEDSVHIWPLLEKALSGKTWNGKEEVLEAMVVFAQHSDYAKKDTAVASQMQVSASG